MLQRVVHAAGLLLVSVSLSLAVKADPGDCDLKALFEQLNSRLAEQAADRDLDKLTGLLGQAVKVQDMSRVLPAVSDLLNAPTGLPLLIQRLDSAESPLHALMDEWHVGRLNEKQEPWQIKPLNVSPDQTTLAAILERMIKIQQHLDLALKDIEPAVQQRIRHGLPEILDRTSSGSDLSESDAGRQLAAAIERAAMEHLRTVVGLLAGLADPALADRLRDDFHGQSAIEPPAWLADDFSGKLLQALNHPIGPVIVGGPGNNRYKGPAALIVDLGGDNIYALPPDRPVQVIIDLEGNDQYIGLADGQLAGAVFGASLIVDHAGDDIYEGGRISQGAGVLGVGMLVDHDGNDRFFAQELAQGAGLGGLGVLWNQGGDNQYSATKFAQGFGGALGAGLLYDEAGDDHYLAGFKHPSGYGEPGHFQSFSQGVGMGFRGSLAGGLGWLIDQQGDDHYRGGHFSQGIGYYLGLGLLLDRQGNDRYFGGRYSQGSAAHLGVGVLIDEAGDDGYTGRLSASQGAAWDLALGMFVDCSGDDRHRTDEFGLGAAAQHAIGIFISPAGSNQYHSQRDAFGHSGPTDYHETDREIGNLAIFWGDEGQSEKSATDVQAAGGLIINTGREKPDP